MLSREDNDLLTQTGPGTPMGEMFRRYWLPVLRSDELPENDCPPVRVQILSERLIAFRDSDGQLGLIDEFCAHRGISLWFGRNEEGGLRCPYHGWKYDVNGNCTEIPSEPEESGLPDGCVYSRGFDKACAPRRKAPFDSNVPRKNQGMQRSVDAP